MREMSQTFVAAYRLVAAALALTGIALLFVVEHGGPGEFVYFTTQGNVLAGGCFLWGAVAHGAPRRGWAGPSTVVRGGITLYIMVIFLVFHLVLANPASGFADDGAVQFGSIQNLLLHTVTPALALLDWILITGERPRWRWAAAWLAYPLAYLVFVLVRGTLVHRYPYPFLDVRSLGYRGVAIVAFGLLVLFWLLGLLTVAVRRPTGRVRSPSHAAASAPDAP
ncbi:MAG: hypothetical protein QOI74_1127 [Micromonosporaceae bacterium]|nr:hypothetical protein [Micromonosporaceae bacterium]